MSEVSNHSCIECPKCGLWHNSRYIYCSNCLPWVKENGRWVLPDNTPKNPHFRERLDIQPISNKIVKET